MTRVIGRIKAVAHQVASASAEISTSTTDLSQRTEEQAAGLEETSSSMEEIAITVRRNAENARQANQSASSTRQVADRGGQNAATAKTLENQSRAMNDWVAVLIDDVPAAGAPRRGVSGPARKMQTALAVAVNVD
jgi:methyl-accepting chemotaxis protein